MPIADQDESLVSMSVPPYFFGGSHEPFYLIRREVFPGSDISVGFPVNFPVFDVWRGILSRS